jgi:hypothetical protein
MFYKVFFFLFSLPLFLVPDVLRRQVPILTSEVQKHQMVQVTNWYNDLRLHSSACSTKESMREAIKIIKPQKQTIYNTIPVNIFDSTIVYFKSDLISELKNDFKPTINTALKYLQHSKIFILNIKSYALTGLRWLGIFTVSSFSNEIILNI